VGVKVLLESEPPMPLPRAFPDTDSKDFLAVMFGLANEELEEGLGVSLSSFYFVPASLLDEEEIRADWGEDAEQMIADTKRNNEAAWQMPDRFIACLEQLTERLEQLGRRLPPEVLAAVDPTGCRESYFQNGGFFRDVSGCLAAMRAAKAGGATRVRFFAYW
jgi:hypothetical protein